MSFVNTFVVGVREIKSIDKELRHTGLNWVVEGRGGLDVIKTR